MIVSCFSNMYYKPVHLARIRGMLLPNSVRLFWRIIWKEQKRKGFTGWWMVAESPSCTSAWCGTRWKVHKYGRKFDHTHGRNDASAKKTSGCNSKFRQEFKDVTEEYLEERAEATLAHNSSTRRWPWEEKDGKGYPWDNSSHRQEGGWN